MSHSQGRFVLLVAAAAFTCQLAHNGSRAESTAAQPATGFMQWAEGEDYFSQHGSVGADRPPFASRGACLGSNFGGAKGHHASYRFRLDQGVSDARVFVRYARQHAGAALWKVTLDDREIAARLALPATGGWGHRRDREWAYGIVAIGDLVPGTHTLCFVSLADGNNTNLDGFYLATGEPQLPNERRAIERAGRLAMIVSYRVDESLTFEQYAPKFEDAYYPAEEARQRAELAMPRLAAAGNDNAVLVASDGEQASVAVGQSLWGWDLLAILVDGERRMAVLERHWDHWGLLVYLDTAGTVTTIRKAVGRLDRLARPLRIYPPNYEQTLIASNRDLLGEKVLSRADGPSFASCAAFLPDLKTYTFLGAEQSPQIIAVTPDGKLGYFQGNDGRRPLAKVLFDPRGQLPAHETTDDKRGLLGSYLPVVDYGFYDSERRLGWEEIAFAWSPDRRPEVDALLYLRIVDERGVTQRKYLRVANKTEPIGPNELFAGLLRLKQHWETTIAQATRLDVPEQRIVDACHASLVRSFITYDGNAPRYGVGVYGQLRHATFPPTTLSMVNACLEWGLLERARCYLDYYLDKVVREDGTFDYYGPAVSEYGQLLETIVRYVRFADRPDWLQARLPKIESIVRQLETQRRASQAKHPKGDLRHGLISGSPEADTRDQVDYYFSGNVWTWRGWKAIGQLLLNSNDPRLAHRGKQLLSECQAYRTDIEASIEKSIRADRRPPFIPPTAGAAEPFERMTQDRFASYTNYRYWVEMLSAGFLQPQWHAAIIDYRTAHGGEVLGTTRFAGHLDDWPYAGYAYGLLLADRVDHYLLGFYGDLAAHRMHGTFTAYEQVAIRGLASRAMMADYCVPAQLVTPLLAKWMLLFEEPDVDVLWLCRATPRRWLAPGNKINVERATTRWGTVSYSVVACANHVIRARIALPPQNVPAEIRLRLRLPDGKSIRSVLLQGRPHQDFNVDQEVIRIVPAANQTLELVVQTR